MRNGKQRRAVPGHANSCELLWELLPYATRMINEHTNADGKCACCGDGWPCDIACRAEFFLGGL